jgi:hypothetical protein
VRLIAAHRILIGAAIIFFLFYAGRMVWSFMGGGGPGALVGAVTSAAVALGLTLYYRTLGRWGGRS